jgi:hypothetical protein
MTLLARAHARELRVSPLPTSLAMFEPSISLSERESHLQLEAAIFRSFGKSTKASAAGGLIGVPE